MLAKRPLVVLDDFSIWSCRRRLGRSEALRIVGLALSISDMFSAGVNYLRLSKNRPNTRFSYYDEVLSKSRVWCQMNSERLQVRQEWRPRLSIFGTEHLPSRLTLV